LNTSKKYYSDPDEMPLINWEKCLNGKFSYMRLSPSKPFFKTLTWLTTISFLPNSFLTIFKYNDKDIAAFYKFYNEYIDRYNLPDQQMRYLAAQRNLIDLQIQYLESGNSNLLTQISIEKIIVKELKPSNEGGMTIGQMIVVLGKWFGSWINKKEITVGGYKDLIQEYERANKEK